MVSVRPLEIEGYQHESVPNLFFQAKEKASEHLALLRVALRSGPGHLSKLRNVPSPIQERRTRPSQVNRSTNS